MTLWTEPPRIRQQRTLEEFPSPGLDALGAAATQALYDSPSWQISRRLEDARARDPYIWEYDDYGARIVGDKPMVDRATAIAKAKEQGVELKIPDTGVTEDFLALQIKRKKEYQQREDIRARSPKGLLFGTAEFTTGLAASMLDPLNIAASFIPVGRLVAPAMAMRAETAATLGQRTLARAGIGAIEGTVGQTLVEPLTAFSYSQEQLDYTLVDSLQNIAFGAILGSAAHTGFGLIRDKLGPKPQTQFQQFMDNLDPTVKINALKAEVANIVEGRNGDISPIVRPFVKDETFNVVEAPETAAQTTFTTAKGSSYVVNEDGTTTRNKAFRAEHGPAEQGLMPKSQTTFYVDDAGLNALGEFQTLGTGKKRLVQLPDGRYGMQYEEGPSAGKIEGRTVSNVSSTPQIGMYPVELWEDGSVVHFGNKITALNKVQTAAQTVEPKQTAVDMDSVARAAEQRYAPENNKYADVQALRELDAMPVKDDAVLLKEQADEMMAEAKMHAEQLGLDLPELKQLADIDAKATQYAKAVKAAAVCGIRG
jgi:hypothetical protein